LPQGLEQLVNLGPNLPALQAVAGMLGGAIANPPPDEEDEEEDDDEEAGDEDDDEEEEDEEEGEHAQGAVGGEGGEVGGGDEGGHLTDTTASAPGSDDEAAANPRANVLLAVDRSNNEADAGSDSGGSGTESLGAIDHHVDVPTNLMMAGPSGQQHRSEECAAEENQLKALSALRLAVLDQMLPQIPLAMDLGGAASVPFFQVLLMLMAELEDDRATLDRAISALLAQLQPNDSSEGGVCQRSKRNEAQLVVLRLFSVLLSRSKSDQAGHQHQKGAADGPSVRER